MKAITNMDGWEECLVASDDKPVWVFKHSTRCPISTAAYECMQEYEANAAGDAPEIYLVKVVESRPISNAIAGTLDVEHQSPQLILMRDRRAIWSASHYHISAKSIARALDRISVAV